MKIGKTREMSLGGLVFWLLSLGCLFLYPIGYVYKKYYIIDPAGYLMGMGMFFIGLIVMAAMLYFIVVAFRTPASVFRTMMLTLLGVGFFMGLRETSIKIAETLNDTLDVLFMFAKALAGAGALNIIGLWFDAASQAKKDKRNLGI